MEGTFGVVMVFLGAYLFWEPSYWRKSGRKAKGSPLKGKISSELGGAVMASIRPMSVPSQGLRIYRLFGVIGGMFGLFVASELAIPHLDFPPDMVRAACVVVGFGFGYIIPRVAENYIVIGGPPLTVVLGYEYLLYKRGIDILEIFSDVPIISEITHPVLSSILLVSTTFLTLTFRMYLRQVLPILMSGLLSGGLIGNGWAIYTSGSFPDSAVEIEMQISAIVALSSISLQMFVKYYGRDMSIKKEKARARERRVNKRTGDMLILKCPSCSEETPHKIVNRKESEKGFEVLVNCRGLNQFDEVCNFHHTVIELPRQ